MPISSQVPIIGYVANGVTKSFAFPFAILSADDLKVKVGADVVTTGFSIAGVGDRDGGSVTFTDAPASLTPIILYREVTLDRTTDYQENGDLLAIVLDDDLDRIWMALQDQLLLSDRALRSPIGETLQQLPPASERALMALAFDANGQPIVVRGTNDGGAALALDLLDTAPGKGAALVGFKQSGPGTVATTVQAKLLESVSVFDFMTAAQIADVKAGTASIDVTTAFQSSVTAAAGKRLTVPAGAYKLGTIQLQSNSEYDFGTAVFYPAPSTADGWLFEISNKQNVKISGGIFGIASYTPAGTYIPPYSTIGTGWANGYFYGGTGIYVAGGSSNIEISGSRFDGYLTGVNIYNSSHCWVHHTKHYNGIAGLAAVVNAAGGEMYGIQFTDNNIIGCGDDGIVLLCMNTSGTALIYSSTISRNYVDKSRLFSSAVPSAVGIRTGYWASGGSGKVIACVISDNVLKDMVEEGLYLNNLEDCAVENNTVTGYASLGGAAFQFGSSSSPATGSNGIIFSGNTCRNPATAQKALDMNFVSNSTFSNNRLKNGNGDSTLGGVENRYNIFVGNTFYNSAGPGIRFTGASDYNVFSGNNFYDTASPYIVRSGAYDVVGTNGTLPRLRQIDLGSNTSVSPNAEYDTYIAFRCVSGMSALTVSDASGAIYNGQELVISVRNQTTGNLGVTWDTSYKVASWGALSTGFTRSVTLRFNTEYSAWTEVSRSADIPN